MADIRVLLTTYHEAFLRPGGGEHELVETAQRLRELGIQCDAYGPRSHPIDEYDFVLHFSVHGGGLSLLRHIAGIGKPIILWPNLWLSSNEAVPRETIQPQLDLAQMVVVKSQAELRNLRSVFDIPAERCMVVPAGVDPSYGVPADPVIFKTIYRVEDYVLWPGIIEKQKNQLTAIEATRDLDLPIVFVGNYRDRDYLEECKRAAPKHFKFLPFMPPKSEIYRSAMQNCRVFLEAPMDHPGLSALEAAVSGCSLVISDGSWSREHFSDQVIYVDPRSPESIRAGLEEGLRSGKRNASLSQHIRDHFLLPGSLTPLVTALESMRMAHS